MTVCLFAAPSRFVWSLQRAYLPGLCGSCRGFTFLVCVVFAQGLPSCFVWSLHRAYLFVWSLQRACVHGLCGHYQGFTFTVCVVIAEGLPSWFVGTSPPAGSSPMRTTSDVTLEGELKSGKYGVVRSLLRVLEGGTASKALLDSVIDACK